MRISSFFMRLRLAADALRAEGARAGPAGSQTQVLLASAAVGVTVGLVVVVLETATLDWLASPLADQPLWLRAAGPALGLVVAWGALTLLTASAGLGAGQDDYVRSFHDRADAEVSPSEVVGRTLASVGTIGYGGALGLDGPALYLGGAIGRTAQRRLAGLFSREDARMLLVVGGAAGFAAVFKTPAAGALFAIEVPYRSDVARRVALPAMIGAVAGYITAALIDGATPLFPMQGGNGFDAVDVVGAVLVGLVCGVGARGFCVVLAVVTERAAGVPAVLRLLAAGGALFGLAYLAEAVFDEPLSLGTGYDVIAWAVDPVHSLWLVAGLLLVRLLAVLATVGGGGAGGLFIPLVVTGALVGRLVGGLPGLGEPELWLVVGMAAFAGAGYRTPFAAVAFVAETTGQPGFLVPAVVATAAAQLVMGPASVSRAQRAGRRSRLERRGAVPISMVLETDVLTVPPDATIAEVTDHHLVGRRQHAVAVVDGERYCGLLSLDDVARVRPADRGSTTVGAVVKAEGPTAQVTWLVRDALRGMEEADSEMLAVVDSDDRFVGVVTTGAIARLDEVLERTGEAPPGNSSDG